MAESYVERTISEPRLFSFFSRQRFHRLQIEIVIQMKVVQIFTMNQKIQHVVALTAHLQSRFDPIQSCGLKEFRRFE